MGSPREGLTEVTVVRGRFHCLLSRLGRAIILFSIALPTREPNPTWPSQPSSTLDSWTWTAGDPKLA